MLEMKMELQNSPPALIQNYSNVQFFFHLSNDDYFNSILKKDKIMTMVVIRKFNI